MSESLQQLLVTNFGLSPSGYTGSQGAAGYVGSAGANGYTGSAGAGTAGILISNIQVTDSSYNVLDDTAVDTAGGYIKITGSGFASGCSVLINQTAATSVSFVSSTEVRAQVPATAAGTYIVYLVNTSGDVAIRVNGITFSPFPAWSTGSSLSGQNSQAISIQLSATSATVYTVQAGSTLPSGLTLSNVGLLSGTITGLTSDTTYNFTIVATDAENQDSPRSFALNISVTEPYFKYTTLLLNADVANTFLSDASTNAFSLTAVNGPKPSTKSPFAGYSGSTEFASNDQISTPASSDFAISSSDDFCVEFWVYYTSTPSGYTFMFSWGGANSQFLDIRTGDTGFSNKIQVEFGPSAVSSLYDNGSYTTSYLANKWTHLAFCRSSGTASFFIDGTRVATKSGITVSITGTPNAGINGASPYSFTGYMSNFRWVKGSSVYNPSASSITVPTAPLTAIANTRLLTLQTSQGINNSAFLDSSTNAHAIARTGNATQGSFSPFGDNWSMFNTNTSDNGIGVATNSALNLGTSNFTIECWINLTALPTSDSWITTAGGYQTIFSTGASNSSVGTELYIGTTNIKLDVTGDGDTPINTAHGFVPGVWYHVALTRSGNTFSIYKNGSLLQSATNSGSLATGYPWGIGRGEPLTYWAGGWLNGYISNFRLVTGSVLYSSTFTPPIAPLTAITGTQLLLCQSNRFKDNSPNNFTVGTGSAAPSVQKFSPFNLTAEYSTSTMGGSAYFDGAGDYLTVPDATPFNLSGGTYTIDGWINPSGNYSNYRTIIAKRVDGGSASTAWEVYLRTSTGVFSFYNGTNYESSVTPVANTWNHFAAVYDGTNINLYLNGTRVLQSATTNTNISASVKIGSYPGYSEDFAGYISNLRIVKGTALYSGTTLTVPTALTTAVSGTSLLCNFTNAGVYDGTMQNVLETVGDAKLSTAQSKFGGSSMYFDGTGDYLSIPSSANFALGTGDFTIECWIYLLALSNDSCIIDGRDGTGSAVKPLLFVQQTLGYTYFVSGSGRIQAGTPVLNSWKHIAVVRSGGTTKMYVDGTQTGSSYTDSNNYLTCGFRIGYFNDGVTTTGFNGYIDSLRVTRGYARYTANFTPPAGSFLGK
jgi:hypothetical protein